jgi:hypothetical protein
VFCFVVNEGLILHRCKAELSNLLHVAWPTTWFSVALGKVGGLQAELRLLPTSAGFLLHVLFDPSELLGLTAQKAVHFIYIYI